MEERGSGVLVWVLVLAANFVVRNAVELVISPRPLEERVGHVFFAFVAKDSGCVTTSSTSECQREIRWVM